MNIKKILFIVLLSISSFNVYAGGWYETYLGSGGADSACYAIYGGGCTHASNRNGVNSCVGGNYGFVYSLSFSDYFYYCTSGSDPAICPAGMASDGSCVPVPPSCNDLGFDPNSTYPDGFCPNAPDNNDSSSESTCDNSGSNVSVPVCNVKTCPDGSFSTSTTSCPDAYICEDGRSVSSIIDCDVPTFRCSDGSLVTDFTRCQDPTSENKTCANGDVIPLGNVCLDFGDVTCSDGSTAPSFSDCPVQPAPNSDIQNKTCPDGTKTQGECPPPVKSDPTVKDTSISTTTTTTINNDGSSSSSTSITSNEIDLAATNARLDKIIQNDKDFRGKPEDYSISNITKGLDGIIAKDQEDSVNSITNFDLGFGSIPFNNSSDWLGFFPTSTGCTGSINTTIFGRAFVLAPCEKLAPLRESLAWVFSIYFIIALFKMAFTVRVSN